MPPPIHRPPPTASFPEALFSYPRNWSVTLRRGQGIAKPAFTPGAAHTFAHTIARDEPHPINAPFTLERFTTGRLIDEAAAAAVAH